MARKVDSPKSGYSIGQGLFTTSDVYATPQHVVLSHAAGVASEGILSLLGVGSMQDRANELRRIHIPRTPVNKGKKGGRVKVIANSSPLATNTAGTTH